MEQYSDGSKSGLGPEPSRSAREDQRMRLRLHNPLAEPNSLRLRRRGGNSAGWSTSKPSFVGCAVPCQVFVVPSVLASLSPGLYDVDGGNAPSCYLMAVFYLLLCVLRFDVCFVLCCVFCVMRCFVFCCVVCIAVSFVLIYFVF